jgi:hypothetical protein
MSVVQCKCQIAGFLSFSTTSFFSIQINLIIQLISYHFNFLKKDAGCQTSVLRFRHIDSFKSLVLIDNRFLYQTGKDYYSKPTQSKFNLAV